MQPAGKKKPADHDIDENRTLVELSIGPHPDGVPPVVKTGISNIYWSTSTRLSQSISNTLAKVRVPDTVRDWANMSWVGDPSLEVALPGDVEQVACNPKADDR